MKAFSEITKQDEALVGTKAFRLAQMAFAGFPVKDGVALTTDEVALIARAGEVPSDLQTKIARAFHEDVFPFLTIPVAVRSSAYGEDGDLSWAGQFTSVLGVKCAERAEALCRAANAMYAPEVAAYARTHGVEVPPLALIVQEMVDAAYAGVLFTKDPVGNGGCFIIEAVPGLGSALVDGTREPHRLFVMPDTLEILREEGPQEPLIPDDVLQRLVRLGEDLVAFFGCDQDIEWAVEKGTGRVFVLQSRKITACHEAACDLLKVNAEVIEMTAEALGRETARLSALVPTGICEDVLSDQNIAEILTPHPCPMAFGLFTYIFADGDGAIRKGRNEMGYEIGDELAEGFFRLVAGQPRCSIMHDAFTYRVKGMSLEDYMVLVRYYLERISAEPTLANYPEIVLYEQDPSVEFLSALFGAEKAAEYRTLYDEFFKTFLALEDEFDLSCTEYFLPSWGACIRKEQRALGYVDRTDVRDIAILFMRVADMLRTNACVKFVKTARFAFFAFSRLRNLLKEIAGDEAEMLANLISSGTAEHNPMLAFNTALFRMKRGETELESVVGSFGHLGVHELEISTPRYKEVPHLLLELAAGIEDDPREAFKEAVQKGKKAEKRALKKAGARKKELQDAIRAARVYLPLREEVKFEFLRGYDILRDAARMLGEALGIGEDVFYLYPAEIAALAETGTCDGLASLAERKRRIEIERNVFVPQVIDTANLAVIGETANGASEVLSGLGVTDRVTEGEVVVIRSLMDEGARRQVRPGTVLVTTTTDPAWSPVLSVIGKNGGLVTEIGGLLAHGAIYAREVGIAAVLNVPNATAHLKTGMRVRVDGPNGKIYIVG